MINCLYPSSHKFHLKISFLPVSSQIGCSHNACNRGQTHNVAAFLTNEIRQKFVYSPKMRKSIDSKYFFNIRCTMLMERFAAKKKRILETIFVNCSNTKLLRLKLDLKNNWHTNVYDISTSIYQLKVLVGNRPNVEWLECNSFY